MICSASSPLVVSFYFLTFYICCMFLKSFTFRFYNIFLVLLESRHVNFFFKHLFTNVDMYGNLISFIFNLVFIVSLF